jgi:uracil-DNA glycosylase
VGPRHATLHDAAGARLKKLRLHQERLAACTRCPDLKRPVVLGKPVASKVLLVGQATGDKEPVLGRPFAWTAGKNLFKWFASLGIDEETFRDSVYMAAVCRCFPGKNPKGGDRVPTEQEIANCRPWLDAELAILQPKLIIAVGKLAIAQLIGEGPLSESIGKKFQFQGIDLIPLPHPSGASTWYHVEPGKSLTRKALALIARHPAWRALQR